MPDKQSENLRAQQLEALSSQLLQQTESDRSELAKQLHDELGGLITAAKMDMAWLSARIGKALDAESQEKFSSVVQMLNQAMTLKRSVVERLRPSLLDHFGLAVAIRSHFEERCQRNGIDCVATLPEDSLDLTPTVQLVLFRVAQEVLTGILARGGAAHIELVMERDFDGYVLLIGDDGPPMETDLARSMPSAPLRAKLAGGRIEAVVRPPAEGAGNRVRIFVPRSAAGSA